MTKLDLVYDVLFHPQEGIRTIAAEKLVWSAAVIVGLNLVLSWFTFSLNLSQIPALTKFMQVFFVIQCFVDVVWWLAGTAIWHLAAELMGGKGNVLALLAGLGFARLPQIVGIPFVIFSYFLNDIANPILLSLLGMVFMVWSMGLSVLAIQSTYHFSTSKAIFVYVLPAIFLLISTIIILSIATTGILYQLSE